MLFKRSVLKLFDHVAKNTLPIMEVIYIMTDREIIQGFIKWLDEDPSDESIDRFVSKASIFIEEFEARFPWMKTMNETNENLI